MSIQYLPDFGRPIGAEAPISSDHLFKDTDDIKDVKLRVTQSQDNDPRHHHWTIFWVVANCGDIEVHRRVHVVREIGASHLTNWGAVTSSMDPDPTTRDIFIKRMTLAERKRLEEIGNTTPVRVPDGDWNCQNWVYSVLRTAEKEDLLAPQESVSVVIRALGVKFDATSS
ncbi:hypothetical protein CPC08DRAFT_557196 [Agrocybe pediades]|nr:hypothetical protein CPC08DRAFT_557196 [Agrocybe pediades]